jgi:hypothetical protein
MGQYYNVVCHKCRERYRPELLKKAEIILNDSIAAMVGRFLVTHNHHPVELMGDEGDDAGRGDAWLEYRAVKDADLMDGWTHTPNAEVSGSESAAPTVRPTTATKP